MRRLLRRWLCAAASVLAAASVSAQVPDSARRALPDSARTAVADSAAADSTSTDSLRATERFLRLQDRIKVRLATAPLLGVESPAPRRGRRVFTADSLAWFNGETVADLLADEPGAYAWRGGWLGRAAYPNFRGRGAASAEYLLDGVPYVPIGPDSVAVDAGRLPLSLFDRVEVERAPGQLRVHLFTRRQARLAANSRIQIGSGSGGLTRFAAALEQRTRSGWGLSLFADFLNTAGARSDANAYRNTHLAALVHYVPTPRAGVELSYLQNRPVRRPFQFNDGTGIVTSDSGLADRRSDLRLRAFWRAREDGFGLGADVIAARTSAADSLADSLGGVQLAQRVEMAGVILGVRRPTAFLVGEGWVRSRWTRNEARLRAGAELAGRVVLSADGVWQRLEGGRTTRWAAGRATIRVLPGVELGGAARIGRLVAAPSIAADSAQQIRELEVTAVVERGPVALHGAVTRTSAFTPSTFAVFPQVALLGRTDEITWATGGGRVRPWSWLTLESWASTPVRGTALGQPPRHAVSRATLRTKFLRRFTSGVLDLKLQAGVEYWDAFTVGFDAARAAVTLPTTTHAFVQAQVQLQSFQFYFQQRNTANRFVQYVPGFPISAYSNSFGIRWQFTN